MAAALHAASQAAYMRRRTRDDGPALPSTPLTSTPLAEAGNSAGSPLPPEVPAVPPRPSDGRT